MKKIVALVLSLVMALSLCTVAFAAVKDGDTLYDEYGALSTSMLLRRLTRTVLVGSTTTRSMMLRTRFITPLSSAARTTRMLSLCTRRKSITLVIPLLCMSRAM